MPNDRFRAMFRRRRVRTQSPASHVGDQQQPIGNREDFRPRLDILRVAVEHYISTIIRPATNDATSFGVAAEVVVVNIGTSVTASSASLSMVSGTDTNTNSQTIGSTSSAEHLYSDTPFECSVCLDPVHQATVPLCGHIFCEQCIKGCLSRGRTICPICRGPLIFLIRVYDIDKVMDAYFASLENGGPIVTTHRNRNPSQLERVAQDHNWTWVELLQIEWTNICLTFQMKGWIEGIKLTIQRIIVAVRANCPLVLMVGIACGIVIGILLCRYIQLLQHCPVHVCEGKMTAWEHLVAAFRSITALVPAPKEVYENVCRVIELSPLTDVWNWVLGRFL